MWIFSRYGFYSIAVVGDKAQVRARCKSHLTTLQKRFGSRYPALLKAKVLSLPGRDYPFRVVIPKTVWVALVSEIADEQTWTNFKHEVKRYRGEDKKYLTALHRVWFTMIQELEDYYPATNQWRLGTLRN